MHNIIRYYMLLVIAHTYIFSHHSITRLAFSSTNSYVIIFQTFSFISTIHDNKLSHPHPYIRHRGTTIHVPVPPFIVHTFHTIISSSCILTYTYIYTIITLSSSFYFGFRSVFVGFGVGFRFCPFACCLRGIIYVCYLVYLELGCILRVSNINICGLLACSVDLGVWRAGGPGVRILVFIDYCAIGCVEHWKIATSSM
ncbi:hypothetical protein B0H34DRAFT_156365 [Crassisporium funariophilum]|nr:hypothetical protein B0H34DRAFT_156365 [Crassisporium funariophilum]